MSSKFEKVRAYYVKGLWDENRVKNAVTKGWITEAEFLLIINDGNSEIQKIIEKHTVFSMCIQLVFAYNMNVSKKQSGRTKLP